MTSYEPKENKSKPENYEAALLNASPRERFLKLRLPVLIAILGAFVGIVATFTNFTPEGRDRFVVAEFRELMNIHHRSEELMISILSRPDIRSLDQETQDLLVLLRENISKSNLQLNRFVTAILAQSEVGPPLSIISSAYAQEAARQNSGGFVQSPITIESLKPIMMILVISVITVFFFICVTLFCYTKDAEKLKFADNMSRMIVGFYIGVVTGLLGLPK